jgi:hypothetical protein
LKLEADLKAKKAHSGESKLIGKFAKSNAKNAKKEEGHDKKMAKILKRQAHETLKHFKMREAKAKKEALKRAKRIASKKAALAKAAAKAKLNRKEKSAKKILTAE